MSGTAIGLSALLTACASTPPSNPQVTEAENAYEAIANDPYVARAGSAQLRSAEQDLERARQLLEKGADEEKIEHAAYLAHRHAQVATEKGKQSRLQEEVKSAESRREELELKAQTLQTRQAQLEAEALRAEMEALQAEKTDRGMVLTLGDVLFDTGKAELKSSGERTVTRLSDFMKEYEERRVRIEGYTDSTGADSFNQKLSEDRANAVRQALRNDGIDSSRIEVTGYGEAYPVASNDTSSGRQRNRRVEIVISDENGELQSR
jgi:outer membrane protein OmpA-like peptidoglycan-associated protein